MQSSVTDVGMFMTATVPIQTQLKAQKKPKYGAIALLTPGVLIILILAVVPIFLVLRNSFAIADNYGGITGGFTFENYTELLKPVYLKMLLYSVGLAAANTVVCVILGYFTSYYIVSKSDRVQGILLLLVIVPFWTDFIVRTFAWITLLGRGGPIAGLMDLFGVEGFTLIPSNFSVMIGMIYAFVPTAVFPIYASMRSIDGSLREAATDLGCSWWGVHRKVLLPLSKAGILGAVMLTFVPTMGAFFIPVLLGGGKDPIVGNIIVTLYTEFRNQPMGSAVSIVLLALLVISALVIGVFLRDRTPAKRKAK